MRIRSLLWPSSWHSSLAVLVACGGDSDSDSGSDATGQRQQRDGCRRRRHGLRGGRHRPAGRDLRQGHAHGLDRPGLPAAVLAQRADRRLRGLRHRRRHRDREAAGRRRRVGGALVGRHHRGQLERSLGHHRRLDDADQRPARGPLLHRALQLHACGGRGRGRQRRRQRPQHRSGRQEDRGLRRLHLRAVPQQGARHRRLHLRLHHRRRRGLRLRHRHHRAAGPRQRPRSTPSSPR